jgi:23S rRNA pseudouridine1911/1915/1917 synthase
MAGTENASINEDADELFVYKTIIVDSGQQPLRVDKFLMDRIPQISRSKIQSSASSGYLKVNDQTVKSNYKVKPNDVITLFLPHEKEELEIVPEDIPLNIIHEDNDVLVINKPASLVVHPGFGNTTGTLVNALAFHFKNLPFGNTTDRPGIVHRLDKGTTGIMVIAKSENAMSHLAKQFFNRTTHRRYWALVWGEPEADSGTIEGNIGRSLKNRKLMTVFPDGDFGKHAVTHYKIVERFGYVTLVECRLETGRTHQIRAHFKWIGHPLFGDPEYGGDKVLKGTTFSKYKQFVENNFKLLQRQALHAKSLGFEHPATGERLEFDSQLPDDFSQVLDRWRNYIKNRPTEKS